MSKDAKFNEDMILRSDLPKYAFELIHDIAYHVESRDMQRYRQRAQDILMRENWTGDYELDDHFRRTGLLREP